MAGGRYDATLSNPKYCQFEYAQEELPHLLAAADFVLSRAGANSVCELITLRKPHLLVPLSKEASRGDQIHNAQSFAKQGFSLVIPEEKLDFKTLREQLSYLEKNKRSFLEAMAASPLGDGTASVLKVIEEFSSP